MSLFDFIFGNDNEQENAQIELANKVTPIDDLKGVHLGGLPVKIGEKVVVELYKDSIIFKRNGKEVRKILKDDIFSVRYDYEDICHGSTTIARDEIGFASTLAIMKGDWAAAYYLRPNKTTYETKNDIERIWVLDVEDDNGSIIVQADAEDLPLFVDYCNDMLNDTGDVDYFGEYLIDEMDETGFKRFCVKMLERSGFGDIIVLPVSNDKRVSIVAQKDDVKYAMLCKYSTEPVSSECVEEIEGGREFYYCHVGVVLTNTKFSEEATLLAKKKNVVLWDKKRLEQKIKGE